MPPSAPCTVGQMPSTTLRCQLGSPWMVIKVSPGQTDGWWAGLSSASPVCSPPQTLALSQEGVPKSPQSRFLPCPCLCTNDFSGVLHAFVWTCHSPALPQSWSQQYGPGPAPRGLRTPP